MFPRLTERLGTALDLVVEFSTLGEYGVCSPLEPTSSSAPPAAPVSPVRGLGGTDSPVGRSPRHSGITGVAAGRCVPAATPAGRGRRRRQGAPPKPEQHCLSAAR
jgi:hypothetical protein